MKLKYYLRGLAAGILFSVLVFVFIVGPKDDELTDEEIIQRAKQLGMKEVNIDMEKLRDNSPTPSPTSMPATPTPSPTVVPATPAPAPTDDLITKVPTPTVTPTNSPTPSPTPTSTPVPTEPPVIESESVTIEIKRGMTSESIAFLIASEGVVENAMELNAYLISNGYAEQLRIGTFSLRVGMKFDEIASVLTK